MDPTAVYPPVAVKPLFWSHIGRLSASSSASPLLHLHATSSGGGGGSGSATAPSAADIAAAKFLKAKIFELHPELPHVVCADVSNVVRVFDIQNNKCMCVWELVDIIRAVRHGGGLSSRSYGSQPVYASAEDAAKRLSQIGHIKRVAFIDRLALTWTCGHALPEDSAGFSQTRTGLMILTDAALLFLDYASGLALEINAFDLGTRPPTYAEFLYPNICAIGTSDGLIRLWNMNEWSVSQTLSGHFKEVVSIKNCVTKRIPSWDRQQHQSSSVRVRVVSVSSDGAACLWLGYAALGGGHASGRRVGGGMGVSAAVSFPGESPAAQFSCPGVQEVYFDEHYDVLYTVSGDRTLNVWDLSSVKEKQAVDPKAKSSGRRRSILGGGGNNLTTETKLQCVAKAKLSANDLPPSLARYTSIHGLDHPRYPDPVFAISAKNTSIGLVQFLNAQGGDDGKSESSSVKSGGTGADMSLKYRLVHELHVTTLFMSYLTSLSRRDPNVHISPVVVAACKDTLLRVYAVKSHVLHPHIFVAATSVGILAFSVHNAALDAGAGCAVASHFAWGNHSITYADRCVKLISVKVDNAIASQREGTLVRRGNSYSVGPGGDSVDGSTHSSSMRGGGPVSGGITTSKNTTEDDMQGGEDDSGINAEVVDEFVLVAAVSGARGGVGGGASIGGLDSGTGSSSKGASHIPLTALATITSRPVFYPSCSGLFCAIFFPDTLFYVLLRVNVDDRRSGVALRRRSLSRNSMSSSMRSLKIDATPNNTSRMSELERGMCYSMAWTCAVGAGGGDNDGLTDLLCIITTPKKVESAAKRRMSIFGGSESKKKSTGGVIPSMLVVKEVGADGKIVDVINPGAPDTTCEVLGGGSYLCVTSPAVGSASSGGSKQKALSKVELEAAEERSKQQGTGQVAQVSLEFTIPDDSASKYSNIAPDLQLKSQFYRAVLEKGASHATAGPPIIPPVLTERDAVDLDESFNDGNAAPPPASTASNSSSSSSSSKAGDARLRLEAIGPVFVKITSVHWDRASGLVAITTIESDKITILSLSEPGGGTMHGSASKGAYLRVLGSVDVPRPSSCLDASSSVQRMWWHCGTLFVLTASGVYAVFTSRSCKGRPGERRDEDILATAATATGVTGHGLRCNIETVSVASIHQTCDQGRLTSCSGNVSLPSRCFGLLETVGVCSGYLVLAARSGHLSAVPLHRSPVLAVGMLASMLDVLPLSGSSKKQSDGNSSGVTTSGVDRAAVLASIMKWLSQLHPQLQVSVAGALLSDDILAQHMCSASVSEDLPQGASLSYVLSTLVSTLCSSHKSSIQADGAAGLSKLIQSLHTAWAPNSSRALRGAAHGADVAWADLVSALGSSHSKPDDPASSTMHALVSVLEGGLSLSSTSRPSDAGGIYTAEPSVLAASLLALSSSKLSSGITGSAAAPTPALTSTNTLTHGANTAAGVLVSKLRSAHTSSSSSDELALPLGLSSRPSSPLPALGGLHWALA